MPTPGLRRPSWRPRRPALRRPVLLGPGRMVIGKAAEFDYSGTRRLTPRTKGVPPVTLVNSNPATIMTDPELADRTYIEPVTPDWVRKVIERERPDALLPTMGGQTALNVAMALARDGTLERYGVELIGANARAIQMAEDRAEFELEVMRDRRDNVVIVCSIENLDPMGVHTGDSITVAPAMTLTDREYQRMRDAAIAIIREIGVEAGGCNIQFAVNPADGEMLVIEMNPR